jgi:hypothetical protein
MVVVNVCEGRAEARWRASSREGDDGQGPFPVAALEEMNRKLPRPWREKRLSPRESLRRLSPAQLMRLVEAAKTLNPRTSEGFLRQVGEQLADVACLGDGTIDQVVRRTARGVQ